MIGYHFQTTVDGWPAAVAKLPAHTPVKAVNRPDILREAKGHNPGVLTILRHWYDAGQTFDGAAYPVLLDRARQFFAAFLDDTFAQQYAAYVDVVETWNETIANSQTPEEQQWRVDQERAMCEVFEAEYRPRWPHMRLCLANTAIGNDIPIGYAQLAQQYGHYLGYHPYIATMNGAAIAEDWQWYSGRFAAMDAAYRPQGVTVNWLFTEGGPVRVFPGGGLDPQGGWRMDGVCNGDANVYVAMMDAWAAKVKAWNVANNGRARGVTLFTSTWDGDDVWVWFQTKQPEMGLLADVAARYPLPAIGEPPPPGPPPPPPPPPPPGTGDKRSFEDGWTDLSDRLQQPNGFTLSVVPAGQPLWYGRTATGAVEAKHMVCGQSVPPNQCAGGDDPLILDGNTGFKIQAVSMATGTELKTTFGGDGRLLVSVPVQVHYQPPDVYDRVPPLAGDDVFVSLILNGVEADRWTFPDLPDREWIELSGEADAPVAATLRFQTSYANSRDLFTDLWTAEEVTVLPDRAYGVDVSRWQGAMDWNKAKGHGVQFAFVKATEHDTWVDPLYQQNVAGAKAAGILASAYHFYRPEYDPIAQAEHFWNTVKERGDLRLVLDVEVAGPVALRGDLASATSVAEATQDLDAYMGAFLRGGKTMLQSVEAVASLAEDVAACLTRLQELSGWKPILYTGINFWNTYLKTVPTSLCDLWIADWTQSRDNPILPAGWHDWHFWQFTSDGNGPAHGAQSERIDTNWFNGTLDELKEYSEMIPDSVITAATAVRPHVAIRLHPVFAIYKAIRADGRDPVTPELSVPVDGISYKYQYGQAADGKQYLYVTYGPDWMGNMKVYPV